MHDDGFHGALQHVARIVQDRFESLDSLPTVPDKAAIDRAIAALPASLPDHGLGTRPTIDLLSHDLLPGILQAQPGRHYYGFVTGGVTPAAQLADMLVASYDENVQVALPDTTASTVIETRALGLVLDLIGVDREAFNGQTVTTGATASNMLGLACAREWLNSRAVPGFSSALSGLASAPPIVVLAVQPHYSILKAAAMVGIGCGPSVFQAVAADAADPASFDLDVLRDRLELEAGARRSVLVCWGFGEVNTGSLGQNLRAVADLCRSHGAWLHVDAAFGGFAPLLPEYAHLAADIARADSLTLDGHKWLNVPYDCGLFYTRHAESLPSVFAPHGSTAPAYLAPSGQAQTIAMPSPLNVGIENSRRFRALPLLASLLSLGRSGYQDLVARNVRLARAIAQFVDDSDWYDLLNKESGAGAVVPLNIVLFRGSSSAPSQLQDGRALAAAINSSRRIYVTATVWQGQSAVRLAVSNWRAGLHPEDELAVVADVLHGIVRV